MNNQKTGSRVIKTILFFLIISFSFYDSNHLWAQTEEGALENVKAGVLYHQSLIKNGKIILTMKQESSAAAIEAFKAAVKKRGEKVLINQNQTTQISLFFEGKKVRCEQQAVSTNDDNKSLQIDQTEIYDGENKLFWFIDDHRSRKTLRIMEEKNIQSGSLINRFGYSLFGEPLDKVFTSTNYAMKMIGEKKIDDSLCFLIEISKKNDPANGVSVVWIDSASGYNIRKVERSFDSGGKEIIEINYRKYKDDIWYLQSGVSKSYRSTNLIQPSLITEVEVKQCDVNIDMPKNIFDPIFPSGTSVIDQTANNSTYVIP